MKANFPGIRLAIPGSMILLAGGCMTPPHMDAIPYEQREWIESQPSIFNAAAVARRVDVDQWNNNDWEVSLDEFPGSEPQPPGSLLCWAYCVSQLLTYYGVDDVTPDLVFQRLRGREAGGGTSRADAGRMLDIIRPLAGPGTFTSILTPGPAVMLQDLCADSPVILLLKPHPGREIGHVVVLVGMRFSFYGTSVLPADLRYYDPETGNIERASAEDILTRISWCLHFRH